MSFVAPSPPRTTEAASALLTPQQLAERWSVPKSHVYRLARDGIIPAVRLGRYVRFRRDQIEAWELASLDSDRRAA